MKLFKNRGDFYIPKSVTKGNKQAKVLYILLIIIVVFTVVFVALLANKYPNAAAFFGQGEVTISTKAAEEKILPKIEGKTNFLIIETDDSGAGIHYLFLVQADKSNLAYKACALSPSMLLSGQRISDLYAVGGGAALQGAMAEYFGFTIDYYAQFKTASFVEFTEKLGNFVYNSNEKIRFSGGSGDDKYTLHIDEGEQKIKGRDIANLLRYYSEEKKNFDAENELILRALTQLLNEDNSKRSEQLFRLFIKSATSDITVRDYERSRDALTVFCKKNSDITLYAAAAHYEQEELTQQSVKDIKGYFSK